MSKYLLILLFIVPSYSLIRSECVLESDCSDPKNSCQCYCSRLCGFRNKVFDDKPIYIKNDPAGLYCYCKQWDLDNFNSRCANNINY